MSSDEPRTGVYQVDVGAVVAPALRHWLRILVVTLLAVGLTVLLLQVVPKSYEATASLSLQPRSEAQSGTADLDLLLSSQLRLVTSPDVLNAVIDSQGLRKVPEFGGPDGSPVSALLALIGIKPKGQVEDAVILTRLRDHLQVSGSRDTAQITITAHSADPQLSAALANAVAAESVKQRADAARAEATASSSWLQQEIARLRAKVTAAETAIAGYRADNGLYEGGSATPLTAEDLSTVSAQIAQAQQRKNDAQARADLIRGLIKSNQPLDGVSDVRNSAVIQGLLSTLASLRTELAQKSTTLLANHPTIKALKAQIAEIQDQITAEGRRVADALDAEAKVEADLGQKLRDELAQAKTTAADTSKGEVTLADLQRNLKVDQDQLASDLALYNASTSANGSNQDVRVLQQATVPAQPASPNVPLVVGVIAFLVLAVQIAWALITDQGGEAVRWREVDVAGLAEDDAEGGEADDADPLVVVETYEEEFDEFDLDAATVLGDGELTDDDAPLDEEDEADDWVTDSDLALPEGADAYADVVEEDFAAASDEDDTFAVAPGDEPITGDEQSAEADEPMAGNAAASGQPLDLDRLAAVLAAERPRIMLLACVADHADGALVTARLIAEAQAAGLAAVEVDAGSAAVSPDAGLSDLSAGRADFGRVVQHLEEGHAVVPWGRLAAIDHRSPRPATLVAALSDIYQLVVVNTGKIGMGSTLPLFVGTGASVVLVTDSIAGRDTNARAVREIEAFDLAVDHVIAVPNFRYRVA